MSNSPFSLLKWFYFIPITFIPEEMKRQTKKRGLYSRKASLTSNTVMDILDNENHYPFTLDISVKKIKYSTTRFDHIFLLHISGEIPTVQPLTSKKGEREAPYSRNTSPNHQ